MENTDQHRCCTTREIEQAAKLALAGKTKSRCYLALLERIGRCTRCIEEYSSVYQALRQIAENERTFIADQLAA